MSGLAAGASAWHRRAHAPCACGQTARQGGWVGVESVVCMPNAKQHCSFSLPHRRGTDCQLCPVNATETMHRPAVAM